MSDSNDILNSFMSNKNKEALGEKVEGEQIIDDNFLTDPFKATNTFKGESMSNNDQGLLMAKKTLNVFLQIPIIIGGIFSAFYIVMKLGPTILNLIKKVLFHIWL